MGTRMDKYNTDNTDIPTRSDKNKELYKQIYNAYDEFENLIVPPNSREIDLSSLKREVTSRDEYHNAKQYSDITNNKLVRKEKVQEEQKKENEIYDINELLNKAVSSNQKPDLIEPENANTDYLKKLNLDSRKTNIEQVKELFDDIKEESKEEDESLLKTANLSLDILSDLRSDNSETVVTAPIKEDELPDKDDYDFYSNRYKFSKKDFDAKDKDEIISNDEEDGADREEEVAEKSSSKLFFKILFLVFGIVMVVVTIIFLFNYFNRV